MPEKHLVNVYDQHHEAIAKVEYNSILDSKGKGLTKLKDGRYVLIYGGNESAYAKVVPDETALQEILESGKYGLLKLNKFRSLYELYKRTSSVAS